MAHLQNVDAPAKLAEASEETTAIWNDLNRLNRDVRAERLETDVS